MAKFTFITYERLREVLRYDPDTGVFTWLMDRGTHGGGAKAGSVAGSISGPSQYRRIRIDNEYYRASRLAWLYMTGKLPESYVDHRNRRPADDRWQNLRLASPAENARNGSIRLSNRSGVIGVYWHKAARKWAASIKADGLSTHLGLFHCLGEAKKARAAAEASLFGQFGPNYGADEAAASRDS